MQGFLLVKLKERTLHLEGKGSENFDYKRNGKHDLSLMWKASIFC